MTLFALALLPATRAASTPAADAAAMAAEAVAAHPTLDARRAQVDALSAAAQVAEIRPDLSASVELSQVPVDAWSLSTHPMSGIQLRAQRQLLWPGTTEARVSAADARVAVARAELAEAELALGAAAEIAFWRLAEVRAARAIGDRRASTLDGLIEAAEDRYDVGGGAQTDLLRLQLERDRLDDALADLDQQAAGLQAQLAAAIGRDPASSSIATPLEISPLPPVGVAADWIAAAASRPALAALEAEVEARRREAAASRVEARPDLTAWAGWRIRSGELADAGTDLASIGVSAPIPTGATRAARAQEASSLEAARAAEASRAAALDAIGAQIISAHAAWARAADRAERYGGPLLEDARRLSEAAETDYRVGQARAASIYEARLLALELERIALAAAAETRILEAQLRALTGAAPNLGGAP